MLESQDESAGALFTAQTLAGLLADPRRIRVLAAIALGAATPADVPAAAGLPAKESVPALHRLQVQGLVVSGASGLQVGYDRLQELAARQAADHDGDEEGAKDAPQLRAFVRGRRLHSLPAQSSRRRAVLAHVAGRTFEPGVDYDERTVNELLVQWCQDGDVDHAALRRYLVEEGLMSRGGGVYRFGADSVEPGLAERYVQAIGLT